MSKKKCNRKMITCGRSAGDAIANSRILSDRYFIISQAVNSQRNI